MNGGCSSSNAVPILESDSADVYILSLPSFQWFKAENPSGGARTSHTCHTTGNNQMILIGGFNYTYSLGSYDGDQNQDPWAQQIAVFDMTALQWKDRYNASAEAYTAPEPVVQYYNRA